MRIRSRALLILLILSAGPVNAGGPDGCDSVASQTPFTQFNYDFVLQGLWLDRCDVCHLSGGAAGGLNLDAPGSDRNLVDVPSGQNPAFIRVVPGDPLASLLFLKLNCDDPGLGSRMPMGGEPLNPSFQRYVFDWIANGAPTYSNGFEDR